MPNCWFCGVEERRISERTYYQPYIVCFEMAGETEIERRYLDRPLLQKNHAALMAVVGLKSIQSSRPDSLMDIYPIDYWPEDHEPEEEQERDAKPQP